MWLNLPFAPISLAHNINLAQHGVATCSVIMYISGICNWKSNAIHFPHFKRSSVAPTNDLYHHPIWLLVARISTSFLYLHFLLYTCIFYECINGYRANVPYRRDLQVAFLQPIFDTLRPPIFSAHIPKMKNCNKESQTFGGPRLRLDIWMLQFCIETSSCNM